MIAFVLGTSAEAIKVQPVMKRLSDRGIPYEIWATYQHTDALDSALDSLSLPRPSYTFARGAHGKAIERPAQMFTWLRSCLRSLRRDRASLRQRLGERPLILVHGDTVTTVFGAYAAKRLGIPSAHIEAGLRSGNLLKPFPEEIDRRLVGKLARIHFAPNAQAVANLRGKDAIDTEHNTAIDGVLDTLASPPRTDLEGPYGLVLLHRYELISQPELVKRTVHTLNRYTPIPLIILTDAYSDGAVKAAVAALPHSMLRAAQKLPYPEFVAAMAGAEFIFTDSGGIQQEAGLLGVPTMLHREVTESPDGIGENVVLSGWDLVAVQRFLETFPDLRRPIARPDQSPSDIIVNALDKRGYLVSPPQE